MSNQPNQTPGADPTQRDPETLTTDQVRQGETGTGLRYVLMFSMIGAFVALAVILLNFI